MIAAERLRECVEQTEVQVEDQSMRVTISIDIAQFRENDDSELMLARADNALYAAKHLGRNRCEIETLEQD